MLAVNLGRGGLGGTNTGSVDMISGFEKMQYIIDEIKDSQPEER